MPFVDNLLIKVHVSFKCARTALYSVLKITLSMYIQALERLPASIL